MVIIVHYMIIIDCDNPKDNVSAYFHIMIIIIIIYIYIDTAYSEYSNSGSAILILYSRRYHNDNHLSLTKVLTSF